MSNAVVAMRGECWECGRESEMEVRVAGDPVRPRWLYGEVACHGALCLVCMTEQARFFVPGEFEQALRSALYGAA